MTLIGRVILCCHVPVVADGFGITCDDMVVAHVTVMGECYVTLNVNAATDTSLLPSEKRGDWSY